MRVLTSSSVSLVVAITSVLATPPLAGAAVTRGGDADSLTLTDDGTAPIHNTVVVTCDAETGRVEAMVNGGLFIAGEPSDPLCGDLKELTVTMGPGDDSLDISQPTLHPAAHDGTAISAAMGSGDDTVNPNPTSTVHGDGGKDTFLAGTDQGTLYGDFDDDVAHDLAAKTVFDGGQGYDAADASVRSASFRSIPQTADFRLVRRPTATSEFTELATLRALEEITLDASDATDDVLDASVFTGRAILNGRGGADQLIGGKNVNVIRGGEGDDAVTGGPIADVLHGDGGADVLSGGDGPGGDQLHGGSGNDRLSSGSAGATLSGGDGDDVLTGGAGQDALAGDDGNDELDGGEGADTLDGGTQDDRVVPGPGDDTVLGGPGSDTLIAAGTDLVLRPTTMFGEGTDGLDGVEQATLSAAAEGGRIDATTWTGITTITGSESADVLTGGLLRDTITGGGGDDVIRGGPTTDSLSGGLGNDTLSYAGDPAPVAVTLGAPNGGAAGQLDDLAADFENLTGGSSDDRLVGDNASNVLRGGPGNDVLDGQAGADALDGGDGRDLLLAGPGGEGEGDTLIGGDGPDLASYAGRKGPVDVSVGGGGPDGSSGENDEVSADIEAVVGGEAADVIGVAPGADAPGIGSTRAKTFLLAGMGGADKVTGGRGNDALGGGAGSDTIVGGIGNDAMSGGGDTDAIRGGDGNDRVRPNDGVDKVDTGDGSDVVFARDDDRDKLVCGESEDRVFGDKDDLRKVAKLGSLGGAVAKSGCDQSIAKSGGRTLAKVNSDATDDTFSDGDGLWETGGDSEVPGDEGNGSGDTDGDGVGWAEGDWTDELAGAGDLGFSFEEFGAEFSDDFFGDGLEEFDEAFGEEDGGSDSGPEPVTDSARLAARRTVPVAVKCPRAVTQRCIGEITLLSTGKTSQVLGRATFALTKGKTKTVRVRLTTKPGRRFKPSARGSEIGAVIDARDRGTNLWQTTGDLRVRRARR